MVFSLNGQYSGICTGTSYGQTSNPSLYSMEEMDIFEINDDDDDYFLFLFNQRYSVFSMWYDSTNRARDVWMLYTPAANSITGLVHLMSDTRISICL